MTPRPSKVRRRSETGVFAKWRGLAAAVGGVLYVCFWIGSVLSIDAAWALTLSWHAIGIFLLGPGVVGLQITQADTRQAWLGWVGMALVLLGLITGVELMIVGTLVFGLSAILAGKLPPSGGVLLMIGAAVFLLTVLINGPFWSETNPQPTPIPSVAFITALLLIGMGWGVLGWSRRSSPR